MSLRHTGRTPLVSGTSLAHLIPSNTEPDKAFGVMSEYSQLVRIGDITVGWVIRVAWFNAGAPAPAAGVFLGLDTVLRPRFQPRKPNAA